jgi:hypothetical protein
MVYFMGQDIEVYITTENTDTVEIYGLCSDAGVISWSATTGSNHIFAGPLSGSLDYRDGTVKGVPQLTNVTGLDVSIGTMDEDITYFGLRATTKAEIKKETSISITRKKESLVWDSVFNNQSSAYGRWGVSGTTGLAGLEEPTINHGYRVHVVLQNGTEVMSIPGCTIATHTVATAVDGSADETIEFTTPLTPSYGQTPDQAALTSTDL